MKIFTVIFGVGLLSSALSEAPTSASSYGLPPSPSRYQSTEPQYGLPAANAPITPMLSGYNTNNNNFLPSSSYGAPSSSSSSGYSQTQNVGQVQMQRSSTSYSAPSLSSGGAQGTSPLSSYSAPLGGGGGGFGGLGLGGFGGGSSSSSYSAPSQNYGAPSSSGPSSSGSQPYGVPAYTPKVYKHVYIHAAPDEGQQTEHKVIRVPGGGDKHVNIIFVKAPSHSSSQQTEVVLPEQPQQKTLVYVLVKKPENNNNVKVTGPSQRAPSKPEVFFIRYKDRVASGGYGAPSQGYGAPGGGGAGGPIQSLGPPSSAYGFPSGGGGGGGGPISSGYSPSTPGGGYNHL